MSVRADLLASVAELTGRVILEEGAAWKVGSTREGFRGVLQAILDDRHQSVCLTLPDEDLMRFIQWLETHCRICCEILDEHGVCPCCRPTADPVNHPPHYQSGGLECIDAIEAALGPEGFVAFCRGNAIKYAWRAGRKGDAAEDLRKAAWYLERAAGKAT